MPPPPAVSVRDPRPGSAVDALGVAFALLVLLLLALRLLAAAGGPRVVGDAPPRFEDVMVPIATDVAFALAALAVVALRGPGVGALGLRLAGGGRAAAFGVATYVAIVPIFFLLERATRWVVERLDVQVAINPAAVLLIHAEPDPLRVAALAAAAIAFAPFAEETIFRGLIYPALRARAGVRGAMVGSAVLFATVHPAVDWVPLAAFAVALAWVYERTGSLLAPIAMHAANNALGVATLLLERHIARA